MDNFVHLHVHSDYSLLDGFSNIKKLIARAKALNMPALGLTDHGTMFGVIEFYNEAIKAGIKPIIGVEAYLAARGMDKRNVKLDKKSTHLLLLAENQTGYQNLLKIASAAQLDGFYYFPRIDHDYLAAHSEGLICTSGCMSAEIPRLIRNGKLDQARNQLDWYFEVFGADNFFLELQSHDIDDLDRINKHLIDLAPRYEARFVATNDVHYVNEEDARLQDILLAIQTGCLLTDPDRMRMSSNSYYLRTTQEMASIFGNVPGALDNSLLIAERCNVDLGFKGYHLPDFEVPEGHDVESYLRKLCEEGYEKKFGGKKSDLRVRERLDYELGIIHQMGFDAYFLIVWDLCRYAKEQGIWYNARGSAAGSIVACMLDITLVNPLEHGLIFERFLNPSRVSMPDIDLDFPDDRRAEMMQYTAKKYGDDKVAQIITFGTLGARAAIRDVGRVMDIPLNEVDKVAKLIPNIPGNPVTIEEAKEGVTEFKELYNSAPYLRELIDTACQMEGVVRNAGTHAAGVIITDKPIIEYVPLHRPTGSAASESPIKTITQFEMSVVDALGILKVDFLGLSTLTIMALACEFVHQRHGIEFNLANIPTDDPETYELLGRGETAGVFQVEGAGMRRWLIQMKPKKLAHVIAMVALYRPGPMESIPGYIRRMHGVEPIEYLHPKLELIFNETYGYPVYQEQLMFAAMELASYSPSEADDLRKAVAKKKKKQLDRHREKFINGSVDNGIPGVTAAKIFDDWEEFARYGFNKSHAVDYGIIAVQTGFLKAHYPIEYMTALLSVSKNDTAKVALYVADCRRMEIPVEPPDVNVSDWDFSIEDRVDGTSVIRFGMGAVKNVGQGPVDTILQARLEGRFSDLNDFARRVDLRKVGRRALECLVKVGALDKFGSRPMLLEAMDRIIALSSSLFRAADSGQLSLFGEHTGVEDQLELPEVSFEISQREILNWERELLGLYVSDHPLNPVMDTIRDAITHYSGQLAEVSTEEHIRVAGIISHIRNHQTRAGKPMAFISIEDIQGSVDLVVFPRIWKRFNEQIAMDRIILVEGRVDNAGAEPKILVDNIRSDFSQLNTFEAQVSKDNLKMLTPINNASEIGPYGELPDEINTVQQKVSRTRGVVEADLKGDNTIKANTPGEREVIDIVSFQYPDNEDLEGFFDDMPPPPDIPVDLELQDFDEDNIDFTELPPIDQTVEVVDMRSDLETGDNLELTNQEMHKSIKENGVGEGSMEPSDVSIPPSNLSPSLDEKNTSTLDMNADPDLLESISSSKVDNAIHLPPYLVSPTARTENSDRAGVQMLTIVLRSTEDKMRDVLRLRRIHGIITSYPGDDRFAFQVFEKGHGYLLEFPNLTAGLNEELLDRLRDVVGKDNVLVERITFQ